MPQLTQPAQLRSTFALIGAGLKGIHRSLRAEQIGLYGQPKKALTGFYQLWYGHSVHGHCGDRETDSRVIGSGKEKEGVE